jgi:hypothetical protein
MADKILKYDMLNIALEKLKEKTKELENMEIEIAKCRSEHKKLLDEITYFGNQIQGIHNIHQINITEQNKSKPEILYQSVQEHSPIPPSNLPSFPIINSPNMNRTTHDIEE